MTKSIVSLLLLASSTFIFSAENERKDDYYNTNTNRFQMFFGSKEDPLSKSYLLIEQEAKTNPSTAETLYYQLFPSKEHPIKSAYLLSLIAQGYYNKDGNCDKATELALKALRIAPAAGAIMGLIANIKLDTNINSSLYWYHKAKRAGYEHKEGIKVFENVHLLAVLDNKKYTQEVINNMLKTQDDFDYRAKEHAQEIEQLKKYYIATFTKQYTCLQVLEQQHHKNYQKIQQVF